MSCVQCREVMSEYIDGELELGVETQVERHLAQCQACQAVRDDIVQIVHFSRNLPEHSPGTGLWLRIQSEIESEHRGGFYSKAASLWRRLTTGRLTLSFPQIAVFTSSIFLITLSAGFFGWNGSRQESVASPPVEARPVETLQAAPADETRIEDIMQRLGELKTNVELRKSAWNPEVRELFERDVLHIDQTLAECHHALLDNPKDDVCREMMLNACREKMRLLEGFSDY